MKKNSLLNRLKKIFKKKKVIPFSEVSNVSEVETIIEESKKPTSTLLSVSLDDLKKIKGLNKLEVWAIKLNLIVSIITLAGFFITLYQLRIQINDSKESMEFTKKFYDLSFKQYLQQLVKDSSERVSDSIFRAKDSLNDILLNNEQMRNIRKDEATIKSFEILANGTLFQKDYQVKNFRPYLYIECLMDSVNNYLILQTTNRGNRNAYNTSFSIVCYKCDTLSQPTYQIKITDWTYSNASNLFCNYQFKDYFNYAKDLNDNTAYLLIATKYQDAELNDEYWIDYLYLKYHPSSHKFSYCKQMEKNEMIKIICKDTIQPIYNEICI